MEQDGTGRNRMEMDGTGWNRTEQDISRFFAKLHRESFQAMVNYSVD